MQDTQNSNRNKLNGSISSKVQDLHDQRQAAWNTLTPVRAYWPDRERLLVARLADTFSQRTSKSKVTDAHLSTLSYERQSRVVAQLPTGTVYSISKKDEAAAMLMNLVLYKYIMPHANAQFDLLTKLRMTGVYASVYGSQFALYDYRIEDDYIGPDFWLIPARNFLPQPGKNSIQDLDWAIVETDVSVRYLEGLLKREKTSWNKANIRKLIKQAKKGTVPSRDLNSDKKSAVENMRSSGRPYPEEGSSARITLATKYEKGKDGHWITFAPDFPEADILRDIPNPHNSGQIPIVARYCYPLQDSIFGLGDFERGVSVQKAKDSLINLYLDAVKMSVFPPLKIDYTGVTASTIRYEAGARWLMKDLNAVQPMNVNPLGIDTFQGTYQFLSTALLNQNGTSDTTVSATTSGNPAFGRTPEALQMLQSRESARDSWDRFMLEKFCEQMFNGMINLLGEKQEKPINFHIFDDDVAMIQQQYKDPDKIMSRIDNKTAKLTIPKSLIGGQYKFTIDDSSTLRNNEDAQVESLTKILDFYLQAPQAIDQYLMKENMEFSLANAFKQMVYNSGISDPDEIIVDHSKDEKNGDQAESPQAMGQNPAMAQQILQQMQGGQTQQQSQAQQPAAPQGQPNPGSPQFSDPQIAAVAHQLFSRQPNGGSR